MIVEGNQPGATTPTTTSVFSPSTDTPKQTSGTKRDITQRRWGRGASPRSMHTSAPYNNPSRSGQMKGQTWAQANTIVKVARAGDNRHREGSHPYWRKE